jgi:hypothetical protein
MHRQCLSVIKKVLIAKTGVLTYILILWFVTRRRRVGSGPGMKMLDPTGSIRVYLPYTSILILRRVSQK